VDTGEQTPVVLARRFDRVWASAVDGFLGGVVTFLLAFTGVAIGLAAGAANEVVLVAVTGASVGKLCFRLRIITYRGGGPVGLGRAALRWVVKVGAAALHLLLAEGARPFVGLVLVLADLVPILVRPDQRALHDLVAGTLVVRA
jgi:uncharacterized RDD family membrane protein YckC